MSSLLKIKRPFASKTIKIKNENVKKLADLYKQWEEYFYNLSKVGTSVKRLLKSYKTVANIKDKEEKFKKDLEGILKGYDEEAPSQKNYNLKNLLEFKDDHGSLVGEISAKELK